MSQDFLGPIAIGGVGGSGTRVVSDIIQKLGYYFGGYQNKSLDSLAYTLIFKRLPALELSQFEFQNLADLLQKCLCDLDLTPADLATLDHLAQDPEDLRLEVTLPKDVHRDILQSDRSVHLGKWGWKEPNTHILVDRFLDYWPAFKFICVYRDGRDMAFSRNQNQQKFWGKARYPLTPIGSLSYWCDAHRRLLQLQARYPERILFISLEQLCNETDLCLRTIISFLEEEATDDKLNELRAIPVPPVSIGRWQSETVKFMERDIEFVEYFIEQTRLHP